MPATTLDPQRQDLILGIVGAGLMGRGIAQIAAQGGVTVRLHDSRPQGAQEAVDALSRTFAMLAEKGKLSTAEAEAATARLHLADGPEQLADCHIVVEAIVENLEVKQALFRQLEAVVSDTCILATNTSSLSVTAIAAPCRLPGRVAGFHFFSPVPLMKVVEVIDGTVGEPWVGDALTGLAQRLGHTPVRATDTPGFIVNHAGRGYGTEALRLLGEGVAPYAEIDRILRGAAGFRMGPFELFDLTGLDVSLPVMESIYTQYYQEPRYRPSPLLRQRLTAGLLGRKSGRGFYRYEDGKAEAIPAPVPPPRVQQRVWVSPRNAEARPKLLAKLETLGADMDRGPRPAPDSLCLVLPIGQDATSAALDEELDPTRTLALDPLTLESHLTLMQTPLTAPAYRDAAWALLASDGTPVTVIHDSPGFVVQRVLAMIVNVGCDMAQQRIASPEDIDRAVRLGLGYPHGPLAWGDRIGPRTVLAILEALHDFYRDPRYRPSPWLVRRARLGVSLLTAEN